MKALSSKKVLPLGYRVNNPGNVRMKKPKRELWQGRVPDYLLTQKDYEEFTNAVKGIRAIAVTLITYQDKYDIRTLRSPSADEPERGIIARYAPSADNNPTEKYIYNVCAWTGFGEKQVLDAHDYNQMLPLVKAITRQELGPGPIGKEKLWYTDAVFEEGLRQAGLAPPAQKLGQSRTMQGASMAGIGGTVLGTTAIVDAANEAKSMLSPGTTIYIILTLIVMVCCAYVMYRRYKRSEIESQ